MKGGANMAEAKYMIEVFENTLKFEGILDAASIFVDGVSYEKREDGKYILYGNPISIEKIVKGFAHGTRAIRSVGADSSAIVQMNEKTEANIRYATPEAARLFVEQLAKINNPEWVLMYLNGYNYEEEEDEYI